MLHWPNCQPVAKIDQIFENMVVTTWGYNKHVDIANGNKEFMNFELVGIAEFNVNSQVNLNVQLRRNAIDESEEYWTVGRIVNWNKNRRVVNS